MSDPYLDALEQLGQMRDRAFKAESAIARVREEVGTWPVALDKTVAACADSVLRALDGGAE